jgi:predicted permease
LTSNRPWIVRLYGALARLLPPDLGEDRSAAVEVFAELWGEARGSSRRMGLALRCLAGLAAVLWMEWMEYLGGMKAPGRTLRRGGGMGWIGALRYASRTLAKVPSFTLSAVLLMAVGVGAVTTIFTVVDHVLLRPLPYPEADRLVFIENGSHSGPFFRELAESSTVELWAGGWSREVNVLRDGHPRLLTVGQVTREFLDLFGARAARGRLLSSEDFEAADVVVLDGRAWRTVWAGDPDIVGKTINVDGDPAMVVGVLDPAFEPPEALVGKRVDFWRPVRWGSEELGSHNYRVLSIAGRRMQGVPHDAVQQEMDRLVQSLAQVSEEYRTREGALVSRPVTALAEVTVEDVRNGLGLLLGAVLLLLLVACANVAHLFLARGLGRTREMAVRRAMGAGTGTLTGQLLAESLVVALAGGLVGAGLAVIGLRTLLALNPALLPRQTSVAVDLRVLIFALALSALTALGFGLVPALRSIRGKLADELRAGGRTATGERGVTLLRNGLVAGEVALSLVLITTAGVLLRSFVAVRAQEPGFRIQDVWTLPLTLRGLETPQEYQLLLEEITGAVAAVPGVASVTHGLTMPMEMAGGSRCCWSSSQLSVDGVEVADLAVWLHPVESSYFSTLEISLLAGRAWAPGEARSEPMPIVLNEPLARKLFGSAEAAVGRVLDTDSGPATVAGVAADTRHYGLEHAHGTALYLPTERLPFAIPKAHVAVRLVPGASTAAGDLRQAVWSAAPTLSVPVVRSMEEWIQRSTASRRFESVLFATFAAVTLLLAAGGLYGTLLFVASERRREVGIRLALGASTGRIQVNLVRSGLGLTLLGVVVGIGISRVAGRALESQVWGVEPRDPATVAGAAALLMITALVASWVPARRAGRTDPVETLRAE